MDNLRSKITYNLHQHIQKKRPEDPLKPAYSYFFDSAGKLFRPSLVYAMAFDLGEVTSNHELFASFIEIHHTYSLIHDDLPCMDNAERRRGKSSLHKVFGEWQALLTGDGLINLSYSLLADLETPLLPQLLKLATWALGPKGMIQGQCWDLSLKAPESFLSLIEIHKLKTSRLIQVALIGSAWLSQYKTTRNIFRLGHKLGILFQLFDDLLEVEMAHQDKSQDHQQEQKNAFYLFPQESLNFIQETLPQLETLLDELKLRQTQKLIYEYFNLIEQKLLETKSPKINLDPILSYFNRIQ